MKISKLKDIEEKFLKKTLWRCLFSDFQAPFWFEWKYLNSKISRSFCGGICACGFSWLFRLLFPQQQLLNLSWTGASLLKGLQSVHSPTLHQNRATFGETIFGEASWILAHFPLFFFAKFSKECHKIKWPDIAFPIATWLPKFSCSNIFIAEPANKY